MHDDKIQPDIARYEAWLADRLCDPAADAQLIKLRVRVELSERWLGSRLDMAAPADLAGRIKSRMREELKPAATKQALIPVRPVPALARWNTWMRKGLAAAAAIAFLCVVQSPLRNRGGSSAGSAARVAPSELLIASLQVRPSQDDLDLSALDREMTALESSFAEPDALPADDAMLHGVTDELDRLMDELADEVDT
ncbi:MAG: hypothetical protein IT449_10525 [Phycisphaerales bacterium]|nr:hypothetical protein [Phycisphaerales bacterium]